MTRATRHRLQPTIVAFVAAATLHFTLGCTPSAKIAYSPDALRAAQARLLPQQAQADIVVPSNAYSLSCNGTKQSGITIFGSATNSWVRTRRIWNQHTYHVTNVREDATIPQYEKPHWTQLNTFRTNAQLSSSGDVCKPKPQG